MLIFRSIGHNFFFDNKNDREIVAMIDEKLRNAVGDFILMGKVAPEVISAELRPENLPQDPVEAFVEFRIAAHESRFQSCSYALDRIGYCFSLNKLAFFYRESISDSDTFWKEHERVVESVLTTSFSFLAANFPPLYKYAQDGNIIGGVHEPDGSQHETKIRTFLTHSTLKLAASIGQLSGLADEFNMKTRSGSPLYLPEEKPELVELPSLVFAASYAELSQSFSACIDLEEKSIREVMAQSYYIWSLGSVFGAQSDAQDPSFFNEVLQNRKAVKGCLSRADLYYGRGRDLTALMAYTCVV